MILKTVDHEKIFTLIPLNLFSFSFCFLPKHELMSFRKNK